MRTLLKILPAALSLLCWSDRFYPNRPIPLNLSCDGGRLTHFSGYSWKNATETVLENCQQRSRIILFTQLCHSIKRIDSISSQVGVQNARCCHISVELELDDSKLAENAKRELCWKYWQLRFERNIHQIAGFQPRDSTSVNCKLS